MGIQYGGQLGTRIQQQGGPGTQQYQTPQGTGATPQLGGLGTAPGYYGTPANIGSNQGSTSHHRPPPGQTHVSQFQYDKVLQDSNPIRYPRPIGNTTPQAAGMQYQPFPSISGGQQAQQSIGGAVLGSSTSQPSWYGGGLSPASGLGGGLYPSLVGLYR